ncbi:MAG: nucleotidyl transferase AbiEii/AbiGii toxin family protein [Candidatus Magasanikbacteria bacterium]|nr:nucleotidyl transferase AbiEii/AbiGii toxin family protein [Candidatus Magasanikbacteria bacterium]
MKVLSVLPPATETLLNILRSERWIAHFYLAGGTALALHYGHRRSIDLDWFTDRPINAPVLLSRIAKVGAFELLNEEENTVEGILNGVKAFFYSRGEKDVTIAFSPLKPPHPSRTGVFLSPQLVVGELKMWYTEW